MNLRLSARAVAIGLGTMVALAAALAFPAQAQEAPPGAPAAAAAPAPVPAASPAEAGKPARVDDPIQITVDKDGVSVFAVAADAHELFTRLAKATGFGIIVDDTVKRAITTNLLNRKVTEVLDILVSTYGLSCRQVNGVFMVSDGIPKGPSSYLLSDIDAITTQYVLAPNAKSLLPTFLQDHVKTNLEQNAVILSAPAEVLRKFREDISQFDIPASQIMVEVLMVELTATGSKEFGLQADWTNAGREGSVKTEIGQVFFRTLATLPTGFAVQLNALVTQGKARVRANPRIATVSGEWASIFIGKQRYLSTPVAMTGEDSETQKNSIDAGVRLDMKLWTGGEREIIVEANPEISVMSAPDPKTGLPEKSTRRAHTTVRVRDGETIVIGGLLQQETISNRTRIPILGDLPLVGGLFRSDDTRETTTEMAIFITPHLLTQTGHLPAAEEQALRDKFLEDQGAKHGE